MIYKDITPHICWKSITILSVCLVLLTAVIWFAHDRLTANNNPSSQVFVSGKSQ